MPPAPCGRPTQPAARHGAVADRPPAGAGRRARPGFDITRARRRTDVLLVGMLGVPPYTGGCLVEVSLDEDDVVAHPSRSCRVRRSSRRHRASPS
jgi:hypothetical protein